MRRCFIHAATLSLILPASLAAQSVDRLEGKNVTIAKTTFKGRRRSSCWPPRRAECDVVCRRQGRDVP
jgi:hypothetical protein